AYNVLRPGSRSLLENLLEHGENFSLDVSSPGRYVYVPALQDGSSDDEAAEDEDGDLQPTRRRFGRYSDDDE
ncbi:MAG: hypothetical protein HGA65_03095, partial [Oscillochloris sp.]|nr:hypothetical protein [Oscillochloris sp.]